MSTETSAWQGARGAKWRATLNEMEAMLAPVNAPLFAALELGRARRIADVGCGGGATTRALVEVADASTLETVEGFDVSAELVAAAQRGTREARVRFTRADVATLVPSARFDRLTSRFGVMFFDDPGAAFANLARWLEPGGRFAFAVWGPIEENAWFETVRDVVADEVTVPPIVQGRGAGAGPFRYARGDELTELLTSAGFAEVHATAWRGLLPMGRDAVSAAAFALASFGSFAELLAKGSDGARQRAERTLAARLRPVEGDGAVHLGASVRIVTGTRR